MCMPSTCKGQKTVVGPLELKLQTLLGHPGMLGTEVRSSGRTQVLSHFSGPLF